MPVADLTCQDGCEGEKAPAVLSLNTEVLVGARELPENSETGLKSPIYRNRQK